MAGGQDFGRTSDFSGLIAQLEANWSPPQSLAVFDKRPGALEATRGMGQALVAVAANHDIDGWHVQLIAGGVVLARLSPDAAQALGLDLVETAKIAGGGEWE